MAAVRVLRNFINPAALSGIFYKQHALSNSTHTDKPLPQTETLPQGYSELMGTAVYRIAPTQKSKGPTPLVFFIPGNPGLSEYYTVYLQHLAEIYPTYEFVCPSYRGYSTFNPGTFKEDVYSLQDQIDNKVKILRHVVSAPGDVLKEEDSNIASYMFSDSSETLNIPHYDTFGELDLETPVSSATNSRRASICSDDTLVDSPRPVILMGHSLGGWLVQRVAVAVADDPEMDLQLVCLMTPTLKELAKSQTGQKLVHLARQYPVSGGILARGLQVAQKVSPLWTRVERHLLSDSFPPHVITATRGFVSQPSIVRQWIEMGKEELTAIGTDCDDVLNFWQNNGKFKIWGFFAHQDQFVDNETREDIFREWGDLQHVQLDVGSEEIIHGFCIHHNHEVAQLTKQQFDQLHLHL